MDITKTVGGAAVAKQIKKRSKPHNIKARIERSCRAILSTNHVCVVNIDPSGRQWMFNWKTCRVIRSRQVCDAIFDVAHNWTIYISGMCVRQDGSEYLKSLEIAPNGMYLASQLTEAIEQYYTQCAIAATRNTWWRTAGLPSQARYRWTRPRPRKCLPPPAPGIR